jgi:hypothetical protein
MRAVTRSTHCNALVGLAAALALSLSACGESETDGCDARARLDDTTASSEPAPEDVAPAAAPAAAPRRSVGGTGGGSRRVRPPARSGTGSHNSGGAAGIGVDFDDCDDD